jgi:hypothetical protein
MQHYVMLNRENAGQRRASRDIYPDIDQARSRVERLGSSSSDLILKVRPCQVRMGHTNFYGKGLVDALAAGGA